MTYVYFSSKFSLYLWYSQIVTTCITKICICHNVVAFATTRLTTIVTHNIITCAITQWVDLELLTFLLGFSKFWESA
jgi:hypothetical protein